MTRQRLSKALIVFFLLVALIAAATANPQEQYYRGVYDICIHYGLKARHPLSRVQAACKAYTAELVKAKWYEKTSRGWEWPLKAPEGTQ